VVANFYNGSHNSVRSEVLQYDQSSGGFKLHQSLPTVAAHGLQVGGCCSAVRVSLAHGGGARPAGGGVLQRS
jgi:hypothetical protein